METRDAARGRRNRAAAPGRSVVAHRGVAGTHVQQVKGRYRAPRLFQRLVSSGRKKILLSPYPKLRVARRLEI